MKTIAVIPARMGSSRFPGKPMADIHGLPMIGHCFLRIQMCEDVDMTYVATCDREIYDFIVSIGGNAVMTSSSHERASDRSAEAMLKIEGEIGKKVETIVMVQGDEPMDTPEMVSEAMAPLQRDSKVNVVNLMADIKTAQEFKDPNVVKVVVDQNDNALYFSREPIPSDQKTTQRFRMFKQVCVIPFRRDYLLEYNATPQTPLEQIESVDMLRVLETGQSVKMVFTKNESIGVDTPEDLTLVRELMTDDPLMNSYL